MLVQPFARHVEVAGGALRVHPRATALLGKLGPKLGQATLDGLVDETSDHPGQIVGSGHAASSVLGAVVSASTIAEFVAIEVTKAFS